MNTRPAWGVLMIGALICVGLILSPIWLEEFSEYFEEETDQGPFPPAFDTFPPEEQERYNAIYAISEQMAIDFVAARLAEPVDIEEPNLPVVDPNPQVVTEPLSGNFVTIDPVRRATGTASIFRLSNGRYLVRLQGLEAINGPDLHVLLTGVNMPATREDLDTAPQLEIDLGPLKGNIGNQNYFIEDPAFNIDNYQAGSVVLYSTRYDIVFSYAPLSPTADAAP